MRIQRLSVVIVLTLALSACSNVTGNDDAVKSMAGGQGSDADKVKCKSVVRTGTRIATRVCATNSEWQRMSADAQNAMEKVHRKATPSSLSSQGD